MAGGGEVAGKRGVSWRHREIMDLLHFWGEEKIQEALRSTHRNMDYFQKISRQMAERGHKRSATECRTKTKTMRLEYKKVMAHNGRSGNAPTTCPYFRELDSILRGDASVNPKRLARSIVLEVEGRAREGPLELQEGSEELFSHDLVTINADDLRTSTPFPSGHGGFVDDDHLHSGGDPDATLSGLAGTDENESASGSSTEDNLDKENSPPSPGGGVSGSPPPNPAQLSPGTRLSAIRNRKRRAHGGAEAADRMMSQADTQHREDIAERQRQHSEAQRWRQEFMEVTRQEQAMFQNAWGQNLEVMRAAVSTLQTLGEAMLRMQQPLAAAPERPPLVIESNVLTAPALNEGEVDEGVIIRPPSPRPQPRQGVPKRSCVGRSRDRLTL